MIAAAAEEQQAAIAEIVIEHLRDRHGKADGIRSIGRIILTLAEDARAGAPTLPRSLMTVTLAASGGCKIVVGVSTSTALPPPESKLCSIRRS